MARTNPVFMLAAGLILLCAVPGQSQCPPPIPDEGQYTFVASPFADCGVGTVDYDAWLRSLVQSGRYIDAPTNQFGATIQVNVSTNTGATASYEKAGLLVEAISSDPSTSSSLRDIVGADLRGILKSGNTAGRAWGLYTDAVAQNGADGLLLSAEMSVINNGSDQPNVATTTSKYGLVLDSLVKQSTAAIFLNGNSNGNLPGYWHKGLVAYPSAFGANNGTYATDTGDSFLELLGKFIVKPNGRTGIGVVSPGAQLSVVAPDASEILGTARSGTFLVSSGTLGTTAGSRLSLANIGFRTATTGGNNVSLGVTGQRTQNGSDWTGTALGLGVSVDNTVGAGANLWLGSNGSVGIGSPNVNPSYKLTLDPGGLAIASGWQVYSSRSLKTNIKPLESSLDKLLRLRGVSYDWKADGRHDIGMIAEEVAEVVPEAAGPDSQGRPGGSIDYGRLVGVLVEAVKAQQEQLKQQESVIKDLRERVRALELTTPQEIP